MDFRLWVAVAARIMEAAGVLTMLGGTLYAVVFVVRRSSSRSGGSLYKRFRQDVGKAILLGLEFLVAADIIRTVSEVPTLRGVTVLAVIVLIRTFLSFTLEVELEGTWPWQRGREVTPEGH